ncbi:MAG: DNA polymerase III subunit beta [Simkaniaceae bacterium]|nr:DNA polymerase III subunit beta [Simkaniaceae bacterium]
MKLIVSRAELAILIGKIQSIVPSKPTIPILANILLEAKDNELTISSTDLTVSMKAYTEADVIEEGGITLPARRFFQLIREITVPQLEIQSTTGEIVYITAGSSKFRLHGMHKSEFPSLPDLSDASYFPINSSNFKETLSRTAFAAAREDSRHVLNGILTTIHDGKATFIGTDGKRLAKVMTSIDLQDQLSNNYLVPLKAIEEMVKILETHPTGKIGLLEDKITLEVGSICLIAKLLAGEYPDVNRVIPENPTHSIMLHREELCSLLKQVSLFTSEKSQSIHFIFNNGELELVGTSSDIGEGKVSMPVDYSGDRLEVAFNPHFFLDILRHCKDETVSLGISNPFDPGLITDSSDALFVIMPMRLQPIEA